MEFERKIKKIGGSYYMSLPMDVVKYQDLEDGMDMVIQDDKGKHGKFISFWRKDQEKK